MASKSKPVEQLGLSQLGLGVGEVTATQRVVSVTAAPVKGAGEVIEGGDAAVARIVDFLAEAKVI